ncbi:UNVERIFIED_ORG: protein involved in plasmid replication-relaxation [Anoxybacillus amylolyticus]
MSLTPKHIRFLSLLYDYRCLNDELFAALTGEKNPSSILGDLLDQQYIKQIEYKIGKYAYLITREGVDMLRHQHDIPREIYDGERGVRRAYYRASELDMHPRYMNHQIHTNQFVISLLKEFEKRNIPCKHFNEKESSRYPNIRPDAILSFADIDLLIEMDMSTESRKQLKEKWENYRKFLTSPAFAYKERTIVVLFAVAGTVQEQERIQLIKHTIYEELMDLLLSDIEIYVGNPKTLVEVVTKRIIPHAQERDIPLFFIEKTLREQHRFSVSPATNFQSLLGTSFALYARKKQGDRILMEEGRLQEFFVDDYFFCPAKTVAKVLYIQRFSSLFRSRYGRPFSYLIVGKSEYEIYADLNMINALGPSNVFFTTYSRLKQKPFPEAVFQFDSFGNIHHFKHYGLSERIFESHVSMLAPK